MGTHGRIEKAKQASGTGAGLSQPELALGSPDSYGAQEIAQPLLGKADLELGRIELASIEVPQLGPEADETKPPAQDCEPADETVPDSVGDSAPKAVNRFTLLAACLALAAALGGMVGALAGYSLARPAAPVQVATSGIAGEEFQVLKENVVQARVDLAALKASVDAGNRNGNTHLAKLVERVERMERNQAEPAAKLSKAIENLDRIARAETTGALVPPQPIGPRPSEGWVVRDVRHGTAIIEGRAGTIEVDPGDVVPGMGRVDDIRKQDGRWIVVTPKGIITSRR